MPKYTFLNVSVSLYKFLRISFLALFIGSCKYYNIEKLDKKEVLEKEVEAFKQENIEEYPLFENCEDEPRLSYRICFENTIVASIQDYLESQDILVSQIVEDTLMIPIQVTKEGEIRLGSYKAPKTIREQIPELNFYLEESLQSLPSVRPAHIKGVQVNSEYQLPVAIRIDNP